MSYCLFRFMLVVPSGSNLKSSDYRSAGVRVVYTRFPDTPRCIFPRETYSVSMDIKGSMLKTQMHQARATGSLTASIGVRWKHLVADKS